MGSGGLCRGNVEQRQLSTRCGTGCGVNRRRTPLTILASGIALLMLSTLSGMAAAQDAQPSQPAIPPASPRIQTAETAPKQPAVADAPNLPLAPEPRQPSLAVTQQLAAAAPTALAGGAATPTATKDPLPLSLDDAVRLGLEHNLNISLDAQTARQVSGLQLDALNALTPSLTAVANSSTKEINLAAMGFNPALVGKLLPPGSGPVPTLVKVDVTSALLNVNQRLFNLPAFEIYKAARVQSEIARLNALSNRATVVQLVATDYLRVLSDQSSIRDAESQLVSDRELERQAQARKDAGTGTNLDLIRAQVARQQRELTLVQARNGLDKDKLRLNRDMGLAADQPLTLTDPLPYHELAALPLETATEVAYKRRKDLLSLQAQLHSALLQRKSISYERLPVLTASGYYGVIGETEGLYHGVFVAKGGLDFPIFLESRIRGDQKIADAQIARLRNQVSSLRADVEQQIRSSMLDVATANDLVKFASSNVNLAASALGDAQLRYRAGVDDTLPVVRAQATLTNAQAQLVSALFQFNQAKLQLARNTGVLESQFDTYLNE